MSLRGGVMFTKIIANPPYGKSSSLSKKIVNKMLETFDCDKPGDQTILDPTAGNGNLLVGALIAGFKPENVYGNELDPEIYEMLVDRLAGYGVPKKNLVNMDCLSDEFVRWCNVH